MTDEADNLFLIEARHLAESLESGLLDLKNHPQDRALIDSVFRDLHTLKGSGAMFGQTELAHFLHDFETAFDAVRDGRLEVTPVLIDLALRACDHAVSLLVDSGAGPGTPLLAELGALVSGKGTALPDWSLTFYLAEDTLVLGGKPEVLLDELRGLGATRIVPLTDSLPPLSELTPDQLFLGWGMTLPGKVGEQAIRDVFMFSEERLRLTLTREIEAEAPDHPGLPVESVTNPARDRAMMRIPAERLDEMMDRVGELVIAEARLAELAALYGVANLLATQAPEPAPAPD